MSDVVFNCKACGVRRVKQKRTRLPQFCDCRCASKFRMSSGQNAKFSMKSRTHSAGTKEKMRASFLKRIDSNPESMTSWNSIKGWYKGIFFRSSYEYFFLKHLEKQHVDIRSDVKCEPFRIAYIFEGSTRNYIPDFYVESQRRVYEVKNSFSVDSAQVRAKGLAASSFLEKLNLEYVIVTELDFDVPKSRDILRLINADPCVFIPSRKIETSALDELFETQTSFMKLLQDKRSFPKFPVDMTSKDGQKLLKDISHDCMHELFEAIHLLKNSKQHRQTNVSEFDREAFIEELADVLHYLIEICVLAGIDTNELYKSYMKKGTINFARIFDGY